MDVKNVYYYPVSKIAKYKCSGCGLIKHCGINDEQLAKKRATKVCSSCEICYTLIIIGTKKQKNTGIDWSNIDELRKYKKEQSAIYRANKKLKNTLIDDSSIVQPVESVEPVKKKIVIVLKKKIENNI